jgi:hypothetical protein
MEEVYELTHDPAHTWNPHDQVAQGSTMTENDRPDTAMDFVLKPDIAMDVVIMVQNRDRGSMLYLKFI